MLLFADDVILISDSIVGLQRQLDTLNKYSNEWKLTVNMEKTKVVIFRKGGPKAAKERWLFDGQYVNVVDHYTYLGVLFSYTMNLNKSVNDLAFRGKRL